MVRISTSREITEGPTDSLLSFVVAEVLGSLG